MRLPRGGNREDVPLPGAVAAAVLPVALPLRARRSRGEVTEQAGQRHRCLRPVPRTFLCYDADQ